MLFDAVGTLLDADPPVARVYHDVARRHGSRLSVEEIQRQFRAALAGELRGGEPTSEAAEELRWRRIVAAALADIPSAHDAAFAELWHHFAQPQHWRLFDDVASTWTTLSRRGLRLGIASNFDGRLRHVLAGQALSPAADAVFVSSEIGYLKPDLRFFRRVESLLGLKPQQIALVGDDVMADVAGAGQAGWRAIYLDRSGAFTRMAGIRQLTDLLSERHATFPSTP